MSDPLLRPRSATELLDAAFRIFREHGGVLATVSLIVLVPAYVLAAFLPAEVRWIGTILVYLLGVLVMGAVTVAVSDVTHGRTPTVESAFAGMRGKFGKLFVIGVAQGVLVVIGFLLLIVPGFFALAWLACSPAVYIVEGVSDTAALQRSRSLARGREGHVLGTLILAWALIILLAMAGGFIITALVGVLHLPEKVIEVLANALSAALMPIPAAAITLLYFDLRVRAEGYDLEKELAALG